MGGECLGYGTFFNEFSIHFIGIIEEGSLDFLLKKMGWLRDPENF